MKIYAETSRLLLREIVEDDIEGFFELDTDPEVHKYLGNQPLKTREECVSMINNIRQQYEENGIGRWAVIDKETGEFAGWAGLKYIKEPINNITHFHDVGYRLLRRFWGKGIARESAVAALEYGFDKMKLEKIYAFAHVENAASNNILHNIGMEYSGVFVLDDTPHNWYIIEARRSLI